MRRIGPNLALAVAAVVMLWAGPALAQGIGSSYRYPTPALSPWFNLYNKQGGPVDNYNMYVAPDLQLRSTLQAQQLYNQRQAADATVLDRQVSQLEQNRLGVQPTGASLRLLEPGALLRRHVGGRTTQLWYGDRAPNRTSRPRYHEPQ